MPYLDRPLRTARLVLRPIVAEDWRAILRYMGDPAVTAFLPEGRLDEVGARAFSKRAAGAEGAAVAAIERNRGAFLGHMIFHPWFAPATFEIGWALARDCQGRGYATEAARALLVHAFETLSAHRVIATCQPENCDSWRVAERLGMRREAHFRACIARPDGSWWDEFFYALLREEWASS